MDGGRETSRPTAKKSGLSVMNAGENEVPLASGGYRISSHVIQNPFARLAQRKGANRTRKITLKKTRKIQYCDYLAINASKKRTLAIRRRSQ